MKTMFKYAAMAALPRALALAAASPSERVADGTRRQRWASAPAPSSARRWPAPITTATTVRVGYAPGYYTEPDYAYEPAPVYVEPAPRYRNRSGRGC